MKYIVAIIRPERFDAVEAALEKKGITLMTVSDVRGHGRQRGFTEQFRGGQIPMRLVSKLKLEIAVNEEYVQPTITAILTAAKSEGDRVGDGKIFVMPMEACYRIRTGEEGKLAIGP